MFRILLTSEGEGELSCPFCERTHELPFGMHWLGAGTDPSIAQIITEHYDPGIIEDEAVAIERCANWNRWRTSAWKLEDGSEAPILRQSGHVIVRPNGTIEVTHISGDTTA